MAARLSIFWAKPTILCAACATRPACAAYAGDTADAARSAHPPYAIFYARAKNQSQE